MTESAIVVSDVWKSFRKYHQRSHTLKETLLARRSKYDEFWAVRGVSFEVPKGEMLGIIGPNGSGKSTTLKCLARILSPDSGQITINGSLSSLLELGTGFHPELSGRENIYLAGSILGMRRDEIDSKFDSILDFSGLAEFIDTPIKNYSSGMTARLAFSVAISIDPEILLVDEVLAVGDEAFQLKCYDRIWELRRQGRTIVLVSHSLDAIRRLCSQAIWLDHGQLRATGDADGVVDAYLEEVQRIESEARTATGDQSFEHPDGETVRLRSVELVDDAGTALGLVRTGEKAIFRVHYESDADIKALVFTLKLYRTFDDLCITGLNSMINPVSTVFSIAAGEGYADFELEQLPLWQGTYRATVAAGDDIGSATYDLLDHGFEFMVVPNNFPQGHGVVYVPGRWSISESE